MDKTPNLSMKRVVLTWLPLAASWLLMGAEMPLLSAVVARLADPEIHLAAYGGVVFPLALIVESPIIMLLAASTALSKDWDSYRKLRRFMLVAGAVLTALHLLVALTPLYDVVVEHLLSTPLEVRAPARIGLILMTPWTWSIAYRRFHQGVLIRFGRSWAVGVGTLVRLGSNILLLTLGYMLRWPGIVTASSAVAAGVLSEAVFTGFVTRPVIRNELKLAPPVDTPLTLHAFIDFYVPLALTSLLTLIANPLGSAAMGRMPQALNSLAAWSTVSGLIFLLRSVGVALNEVVVALLDEPQAVPVLRRFTLILAIITTVVLVLVAGTPLSALWFINVSALKPQLAELAIFGLWVALPLPALSVFQSWYQGSILHSRRTRGITESVVIYLLTSAIVLGVGILWNTPPGLYIGIAAMTLSMLTQTAWLWWRSRGLVGGEPRIATGEAGRGVERKSKGLL